MSLKWPLSTVAELIARSIMNERSFSLPHNEFGSDSPRYSSWAQVAGYFDGDGNVRMEVLTYVLRFGVRLVDTWRPQLESVRSFLNGQGLKVMKVGLDRGRAGNRRPAYRLDVGETSSVIALLKSIAGLCVKKSEDIRIALDYLENRMTGDEAVARFNDQTRSGRRRGKLHTSNMPYFRKDGLRLHELTNARKAREAHRVKVDEATLAAIHKDKLEGGLGEQRLSRKYGLSEGVVRRILRELALQGS